MADVKRMIHDAFGWQMMRREGSGGDPSSARLYAVAIGVGVAGRVMAEVDRQPRPIGAVLRVCYAPAGAWSDADLRQVSNALVVAFIRGGRAKVQDRTLLRLGRLAEVAALNQQAAVQGGGFSVSTVCDMSGVDRSNWYKRQWAGWFQDMESQLDVWRRAGLGALRHVCDDITVRRAA